MWEVIFVTWPSASVMLVSAPACVAEAGYGGHVRARQLDRGFLPRGVTTSIS